MKDFFIPSTFDKYLVVIPLGEKKKKKKKVMIIQIILLTYMKYNILSRQVLSMKAYLLGIKNNEEFMH